jgi:hypothetical protein
MNILIAALVLCDISATKPSLKTDYVITITPEMVKKNDVRKLATEIRSFTAFYKAKGQPNLTEMVSQLFRDRTMVTDPQTSISELDSDPAWSGGKMLTIYFDRFDKAVKFCWKADPSRAKLSR